MCFWCGPSKVVEHGGLQIVFTRVADSDTHPSDLDLDPVMVASFEAAEWLYVGLTATVMRDNRPVATSSVYGVPEGLSRECAFSDEVAMTWVGSDALEQYAKSGGIRVA